MRKNGLEEYYVRKGKKKLRFGYTTGSCAAAAAKAAAKMLFSGTDICAAELLTPKGIRLYLEILEVRRAKDAVSCAVQKDAGDDPDVTNGLLIFAEVRRCSREHAAGLRRFFGDEMDAQPAVVGICAGEGVGRVTLPGLEQPIGAAAINRVPREMICREVGAVCEAYGYSGGVEVKISVPGGEETAEKTFNPRLGILGGISILGTSGIVEPMSERALLSSIEVELKQKTAEGKKYALAAPGNYGLQYLSGHFPFEADAAVKCSNYVGQIIDFAIDQELKGLLFVAHIGKFIKVAGGIMNTHSREADARMEILASCALRAGADENTARRILSAVTTDEGLAILKETDVWEDALLEITKKVEFHLEHRSQGLIQTGAVLYSHVFGELGRTSHADELLAKLQEERR